MMTPEQLQAVTDAARKVVETFAGGRCPRPELDAAIDALRKALDAPVLVPEGAARIIFHQFLQEHWACVGKRWWAFRDGAWESRPGSKSPDRFLADFPEDTELLPNQVAAFFAAHGTPPTGGTK